jgi:hypothetical protein
VTHAHGEIKGIRPEWHCRLRHKGLRRSTGEQFPSRFGAGLGQ